MKLATEKYRSTDISGHCADVARVTKPSAYFREVSRPRL